ncbi:MAG TPA: YihY/virulence factor BrkB family protein [Terriglobales bacterium]
MAHAAAAVMARAKEVAEDRTLRARLWDTAKYLTQTQVHTYAFSVAANAILSFFPFLLLMLSLTERKLHSPGMTNVFYSLLRDYLPVGQDFVIGNLRKMVWAHGGIKVFSLVMLLFTSSGVFLPLEVALNEVWGIKKNRSYLHNQIVSLALAFACGALAMLSVAATAGNRYLLAQLFNQADNIVVDVLAWVIMKVFALIAGILIFFVIYWGLPNGKVPLKPVFTSALVTGVVWEVCKYGYILCLPLLKFQDAYGPFSISVTLIFWAFLSGLLLLGGAHLSANGTAKGEALVTKL